MSEPHKRHQLEEELLTVEARLASLTPNAGTLNVEEILFEAGRRAALRQLTVHRRWALAVSTTLAACVSTAATALLMTTILSPASPALEGVVHSSPSNSEVLSPPVAEDSVSLREFGSASPAWPVNSSAHMLRKVSRMDYELPYEREANSQLAPIGPLSLQQLSTDHLTLRELLDLHAADFTKHGTSTGI